MMKATSNTKKEEKAVKQYPLLFIQRFKGKVLFNVPMSDYTSLRIGGQADVMAFPQDDADLREIITFAESKAFPFYIMGGGTNLLVRDGGVRGIVVNLSEGFKDMVFNEDGTAIVGGGVKLPDLVLKARDRGLSGLEFACSIPGTVGGAVAMNAGAYGGEMKDVVEGAVIVGRKGKRGFLSRDDLKFSYRRAEVPEGAVITAVHMRLEKKDVEEINGRIKEFREKRRTTSSIGLPNAGSVFKNPEGQIAGRLIEEAGLKGERVGDAVVSEVHANYIVNAGRARAKDVLMLMALIRDKVYRTRGIVLDPEIKVIGED